MNQHSTDPPAVAKLEEMERTLQAAQDQVGDIPRRSELERLRRYGKFAAQTGVALAIIISLVSLVISFQASGQNAAVATRQQLNDSSIDALRQANQQLTARGLPSLPLPQPGDNVDVNAIAQAAAAIALGEIRSDSRFQGQPGPTGPAGAPCIPANPACVGPSGAPGASGAPCLPSNPPCRGPDGAPAQDGKDGVAGKDGADGAPGAAGANGRGITSVVLQGDKQACQLLITYDDGQAQGIPVDPAVCPAVASGGPLRIFGR